MISASLVKELRDKTGAGMMDCKKALTETNGDVEQAIDWLREKGIAKAAKKADRIAAEGLCHVTIEGNDAYIFELNSETDFVAKNEQFLELINKVGSACANAKANSAEEVLSATYEGVTGEELISTATATIGEKISLRRVQHLTKTDDQVFGTYKHMGGKIAALALLDGESTETAKDICMHVAAINPRYLDESFIDPAVLEHEKNVLTQEALNEGKPAAIAEKMVIGRINKFKKEICLLDQPFVKNPDLTVAQYVKNNKCAVVKFIRFEVGEGMEKRANDFADEVAAQVAAQNK